MEKHVLEQRRMRGRRGNKRVKNKLERMELLDNRNFDKLMALLEFDKLPIQLYLYW